MRYAMTLYTHIMMYAMTLYTHIMMNAMTLYTHIMMNAMPLNVIGLQSVINNAMLNELLTDDGLTAKPGHYILIYMQGPWNL